MLRALTTTVCVVAACLSALPVALCAQVAIDPLYDVPEHVGYLIGWSALGAIAALSFALLAGVFLIIEEARR